MKTEEQIREQIEEYEYQMDLAETMEIFIQCESAIKALEWVLK